MPTKDELEFEVEELKEDNEELRLEAANLRTQLADAQAGKPPIRPVPVEPSFGLCEGTRADLEQVDKTTDPFTGKTVTRDDVPDPDDATEYQR